MEVTIKINRQVLSVEVSVKVYECIDHGRHKSENLTHEKRRHWDIREFDEYIVATESCPPHQETLEEYVCRKETQDELLSILEGCTNAQRRLFLLYALEELRYEQIARLESCSKYAVRDSVEAVRKKFQDFFKYRPHETPFSG